MRKTRKNYNIANLATHLNLQGVIIVASVIGMLKK